MKIITGIMLGLAVVMSASAGPGRITVTNEAGIVFRDVEVLSENAGMLTIRTANGIEFVKVAGYKPVLVATNVPATNSAAAKAEPKLFKLKIGVVDDFDGHKYPDYWEAECFTKSRLAAIQLRYIGRSHDVYIFHFTPTQMESTTARLRIDGKVIDFTDSPWIIRKTVKKNDTWFELERMVFHVSKEVYEAIQQAGEIRLRFVGNDKPYDYDFLPVEKP